MFANLNRRVALAGASVMGLLTALTVTAGGAFAATPAAIPTPPAGSLLDTTAIYGDVWTLVPSLMAIVGPFLALGIAFMIARRASTLGKKSAK